MIFKLILAAAAVCAAQERFDSKVRNDYFAGFNGDKEALARALAKTGETLAANPSHAEALVWHGSGLFFQAGEAFQAGDMQKGMDLFGKGQGMMEKGVQLEPGRVAVRAPRGGALLQGTFGMPPAMAKPLIEKGLGDYLKIYEIQQPYLDKVGTHPRGELLFGIADAYRRLGDNAKAGEWFSMIAKTMPDTSYAKRAGGWLATGTLKPGEARCVGCHVSADAK